MKKQDRHGVYSVCPATGLPVYTRREWTDVCFGSNYYLSISIIGDSILVIRGVGESDIGAFVTVTQFIDSVIDEAFGSTHAFIYIEDFSDLKNVTPECRHYYSRYFQTKNNLKAVIICTLSPIVMLSVRLGNRFKPPRYKRYVEKDVSGAVKRAKEMLTTCGDSEIRDSRGGYTPVVVTTDSSITETCPVTGLPVIEKPEWTRVDLGGASVTFRFIGNRILASDLHNWGTIDVAICRKLFELRRQVLDSVLGPDECFVEMRNYEEFKRGASRVLRDEFIRLMTPDKGRLIAFIGYNAPLPVRLGFNVGQKLHSSPFPWKVYSDYSDAINAAIALLNSQGYSGNGVVSVMKDDDWFLSFDDFSVRFEVIDGNILHRISSGFLRPEYIEETEKIQERVIQATGLDSTPFYFLNGVSNLEGTSLRARKAYFTRLRKWLEQYPNCRRNIVYGANRLIRASFSLCSFVVPFKVKLAETREEALMLVSHLKVKESETSEAVKDVRLPEAERVKQYAEELTYFLGNINWEIDGFQDELEECEEDHPFKTVYDAIALIKMDIDELFREREITQKALKESEEVSQALLNATSDSSLLITTDGIILSANKTFADRFGMTCESLRHEPIQPFIDPKVIDHRREQQELVTKTGKPVRFEDQHDGRCYDNTIYPVFNSSGSVDRLALYTRDITQLKDAEKYIQALTQEIIKTQENERQRIARDLHDNVAQDLASLIISSDTMFEGFPDIPHEVRRRTMKFSRVLKRAISSIRDLAYDLRPPSLDQLGLVRTLSQYCNDFSENYLMSIDFYSAGLEKISLDFDTEINIYRLVQEALNNVKKHAEATHITIRLVTSFPDIILRVEDDGRGFDPEIRVVEALNEKRMGLKSMEERVKLLSGEFSIKSRPGEGTMILVKLPYKHVQAYN